MRQSKEEIAYTQVFDGPGYHVKVNHPKLTPEEYACRHKQIHDAAARVLMAQRKAMKQKRDMDNDSDDDTDKE
ncbi:MAG: hypothetical protein HFH14_01495 [Lachnospiraceae bacterium]|nr:hypothetical protein [Lachnospiraceae bacterium]